MSTTFGVFASDLPDVGHMVRSLLTQMAAPILKGSAQGGGRSLDRLVRDHLAEHADRDVLRRVSLSGPRVWIGASAAPRVIRVLQALLDDALRLGALSTSRGRVDIRWTAGGDDLRFCWRESGGPEMVYEVHERGAGMQIIEDVFDGLDGWIERHWLPEGLTVNLAVDKGVLAH